ncbi:MAG: SusD/RagB family nutrient-binding outer membrane lipoprotein [Gemmatimonadaceae bacterium]
MITPRTSRKLAALAALSLGLSAVGCHGDFLTGGELTADPNRPTTATSKNLFTTIQSNLVAYWASDPSRVTAIYAQQGSGNSRAYLALDQTYAQTQQTTNGTHTALYTAGGLVDINALEAKANSAHDSLFLGIAQITEGALMGTGADLFGDLVYSQALKGTPNPKLDTQAQVYDSVQKVIAAGIKNLQSFHAGGTNPGPGSSDRVYGGDASKWIALGHTLSARFYMHTASTLNAGSHQAFLNALAQAKQGIMSDAGNYNAPFTITSGEENLFYQFNDVQRGDLSPNPFLDSLLIARNDPRDNLYYQHDKKGQLSDYSDAVQAPDYKTPLVTHEENNLIVAEASYRVGDEGAARDALNVERKDAGLAVYSGPGGMPLLNDILTEEYINDFMLGQEAFILYRRTCTPNLVPNSSTTKIPGRLFYDADEQQTNTNISPAGQGNNGYTSTLLPPKKISDGTGAACLGQ